MHVQETRGSASLGRSPSFSNAFIDANLLTAVSLVCRIHKTLRLVMTKPTQAHLPKTINANQSEFLKQRTKTQMEYYMRAKLVEVGVDPNVAIYRWKIEPKGSTEIWTYSAYWDDSKDKLLQEEANS